MPARPSLYISMARSILVFSLSEESISRTSMHWSIHIMIFEFGYVLSGISTNQLHKMLQLSCFSKKTSYRTGFLRVLSILLSNLNLEKAVFPCLFLSWSSSTAACIWSSNSVIICSFVSFCACWSFPFLPPLWLFYIVILWLSRIYSFNYLLFVFPYFETCSYLSYGAALLYGNSSKKDKKNKLIPLNIC